MLANTPASRLSCAFLPLILPAILLSIYLCDDCRACSDWFILQSVLSGLLLFNVYVLRMELLTKLAQATANEEDEQATPPGEFGVIERGRGHGQPTQQLYRSLLILACFLLFVYLVSIAAGIYLATVQESPTIAISIFVYLVGSFFYWMWATCSLSFDAFVYFSIPQEIRAAADQED